MCVALLPIKMNRARLMCVNVIHFLYQMHFPAFSSVSLFLNAKSRNVFMISTLTEIICLASLNCNFRKRRAVFTNSPSL